VEAEEAEEVGPTQLTLGQPEAEEAEVEVSPTLKFLDLLSQLLSALL
jgi:hypothetical protein